MIDSRNSTATIARDSAMECAAIIDSCIAMSILQNNDAEEPNQILEATVQMLSKMCLG